MTRFLARLDISFRGEYKIRGARSFPQFVRIVTSSFSRASFDYVCLYSDVFWYTLVYSDLLCSLVACFHLCAFEIRINRSIDFDRLDLPLYRLA